MCIGISKHSSKFLSKKREVICMNVIQYYSLHLKRVDTLKSFWIETSIPESDFLGELSPKQSVNTLKTYSNKNCKKIQPREIYDDMMIL